MNDSLKQEIERYNAELNNLLQNEGKFVLIKGLKPFEFFESYDDALKAAYEKYGLEPFLVKKISRIEPIINFTRIFLAPCPV